MDWATTVAREFSRERLTPQLAVLLAQEALLAGRMADSERLVDIARELFDFAAADENRD